MITAKEIKKIDNGEGYWGYLEIGVFQEDKLIGKYKRNYSSFYKTFAYFKQGDEEYALYSPHYTCTQIMSLPSCKKIGGEKPDAFGFCPVELYVPWERNGGSYGFIAGCVWGDDSGGWKLEYIDLADAKKGDLKRTAKWGYLMLPDDLESYVNGNWEILSKEHPSENEINSLRQYEFEDEE